MKKKWNKENYRKNVKLLSTQFDGNQVKDRESNRSVLVRIIRSVARLGKVGSLWLSAAKLDEGKTIHFAFSGLPIIHAYIPVY